MIYSYLKHMGRATLWMRMVGPGKRDNIITFFGVEGRALKWLTLVAQCAGNFDDKNGIPRWRKPIKQKKMLDRKQIKQSYA